MTATFARLCLAASVTAMTASMAHAHIMIAPNQSMAGAAEKYVVRVPTESKVATVAAELETRGRHRGAAAVPNGWQHEIKRANDRIDRHQ